VRQSFQLQLWYLGVNPGTAVKLGTASLKRLVLGAAPESTLLATCKNDRGLLLGHAFANVWNYPGGNVGWITQLVVSRESRKRYIATMLLQVLKMHDLFINVDCIGLVSSHPAACIALAKLANSHISAINLNFIKENTSKILAVTPIPYLKSPILKGGLFQEDPESGVISSIFTQFFVDHDEPLQVLEEYKNRKEWPLGDLLKEHEFVILVEMMPSV